MHTWHTNDTSITDDHHCTFIITKTSPVQIASYVLALVDYRKNTTSASCRGSRPSWAEVGGGCNNQTQVTQVHALVRGCALVLPTFGCYNLPLVLSKMVLTSKNRSRATHVAIIKIWCRTFRPGGLCQLQSTRWPCTLQLTKTSAPLLKVPLCATFYLR